MIKRLFAIVLCLSILLSGCAKRGNTVETTETIQSETESQVEQTELDFSSLSEPALLSYVEETVYDDIVTDLNSEEYFVENVEAIYISKEYLEEVSYNSKKNIYFGYTLSELDACFEDTKYVFTLGDDGQTTVREFEPYDNAYERMIKNVAIGTGVILICVTVSVVTGGGATAVSAIFAASAKSATIFATSSGAISALSVGIVTGIETKDFDETIKQALLAGSEGFKWGAITGAIDGGLSKTAALKGATLNGLTMNEAALIQKESKLPLEFVKNFHSMDEYRVYKNAGLQLSKVNGKATLIQNIDWNYVDNSSGKTNAELASLGYAPFDPSGKKYELHHIGQKNDSPLAVLTNDQHHGKNSFGVLHLNTGSEDSLVNHNAFNRERHEYWVDFYRYATVGN